MCVCVCVCVPVSPSHWGSADISVSPECLCVSRGGCFSRHSRVPMCVCCSVLWAVRVSVLVCVSVIPVCPCLGMRALVPPGVHLCEPVCVCVCVCVCVTVSPITCLCTCVSPSGASVSGSPLRTLACPLLYLRECPWVPEGPSAQSWFSRAGPSRWR